jgi:hypothetical protein
MKYILSVIIIFVIVFQPFLSDAFLRGVQIDYYQTNGTTWGVLDYGLDPYNAFMQGGYIPDIIHTIADFSAVIKHANPPKITPDAKIKRPANVVWVELGSNKTLPVKKAQINASATKSEMAAKYNADKSGFTSKWPKLKGALIRPDAPDILWTVANSPNTLYYTPNGVMRYAGYQVINNPGANDSPNPKWISSSGYLNGVQYNGFWRYVSSGGTSNAKFHHHFCMSGQTAPDRLSTDAEFSQALAKTPTPITVPTDVYSDYYGEIDDYLKDDPNIVHFEDPASGNEIGIPPAVTKEQANSAATYQRSQQATQNSVDSAQNAATNARSSAELARAAAIDARNLANANPGDATLDEKADAAERAADAAERAADAAEAELAARRAEQAKDQAEEAEKQEKDSSSYTAPGDAGSAYGSGEQFDFGARLTQLMNELKGTGLFSLPSQLLNNIPSGGSSTITFNGGRFGTHTYDFSSWGSILNTLKAILLIIFSIIWVKIVCLKGGSE